MYFKGFRVHQCLAAVLALFVLLISIGCGQQVSRVNEKPVNQSLVILTSFYPVYIMTLNIAGNIPGVQVENLTSPNTGCLHEYQLTTGDMKKMQKADIMVVSGGGMESFLDKVITQHPDLTIIDAGRSIKRIKGPDGEYNPHLWVSVPCAIKQVENITEQLAASDVVHAQQYRENGERYTAKLVALRDQMHSELAGSKGKQIVTFHEAFPYFAQEFGLIIVGVIEREPGSEPSAGELAKTIKLVRTLHVRAIFAEPQYPAGSARVIARETGARVYYLDPAVNGPDDASAYIKTMNRNLEVLKEALSTQ